MRSIDADTLMPSFIKKANTMKDRHGVKLGEEWLLNYNDIKDVIDNAPTVDTYTEDDVQYAIKEGHQVGYEMAKAKYERPTGDFTIDELKKWLYEIAYNNTNNDFGKYCVEIVDRLNGFKRFVADMRKEAENE